MAAWLKPGKNYFVRQINDYWLGELIEQTGPHSGVFRRLSWVSETGYLSNFVRDGRTDTMEVEAYPDDMRQEMHWPTIAEWPHPLLRETYPPRGDAA
jgi:hypothetical protein